MVVSDENTSAIQVDVHIAPGPDGPRVTMTCSDRASVVPLSQLLSALRSLTNTLVDAATERERSAGREISCKAGCGACCRQLIPLSVTEARQLPALIESLSGAHRSRVQAKFSDAISKLRATGLWERLQTYGTMPREERISVGMDYFRLSIPCPFLEDESCSIHAVRPLICRQYLVTSPADHCQNPLPDRITRVPLAANVLGALVQIEAHGPNPPQYVPLMLAPILSLDEQDSMETVPTWMSLLLGQIKKIRDEQTATGGEPNAPDDPIEA